MTATLFDIAPAISRAWAMPSPDTFSCSPIGEFVARYLRGISVDPFARNYRAATITNDLNPATLADYHLDARQFLDVLVTDGVMADVVLIDPPYSPRQISECYKSIGRPVSTADTQNAALYKEVRDRVMKITMVGSVVLSFGWNSSGMVIGRGFRIEEILLVCHGSAHNDTICVAEKRIRE